MGETCTICLEEAVAVELRCGHEFCRTCLKSCSKRGIDRCPHCRLAQLMDPDQLRRRLAECRTRYRCWRQGGTKSIDLLTVTRRSIDNFPKIISCKNVGFLC